MAALHQKYNELETDLIVRRDIPRESVKSFMENEVSTNVLELYKCRRMIDAALETPNQVSRSLELTGEKTLNVHCFSI